MKDEKNRYSELSDFLKTRRAKILPSQVGLQDMTRRRTPGLRREEVAQLAGVGLTWYTWLEQGREIRVSAQVIESLSRVLLLNQQERRHLYLLANQPVPVDIPAYQGTISPVLQQVLDSLVDCPSLMTDQRWNVVGWNREACLLFGEFSKLNSRERNIVWAMFTDEKYKSLYREWETYAKLLVGKFRCSCGKYVEDAWLTEFIRELKEQSKTFEYLWSLHEIQNNSEMDKKLNHPIVGLLEFEVCNFELADQRDLKMIVHTPQAGTDTAAKMRALREKNETRTDDI